MKVLVKLLVLIATMLFGLALILAVRTVASAPEVRAATDLTLVDDAVVQKLSLAVQQATISDPNYFNAKTFLNFHSLLQQQFPLLHQSAPPLQINQYSLLFHLQGKRRDLKPIIVLAHFDVVPAPNITRWTEPPFSGTLRDGYVWGRGSMDDKGALIAILQALEMMMADGQEPQRDIYLALGHDEETGGNEGAVHLARYLQQRNVKAEYILDEGGMITQGVVPGVVPAVALIGVAEKGYVSYEVTRHSNGGHSSVPPPSTAVGELSAFVTAVEAHPAEAVLRAPVRDMFIGLAPHMPWAQRMVFSNLWLFEPLVLSQLSRAPSTNAVIRTTAAVTMFNAGVADNVLPAQAKVMINFRLHPGDSSDRVLLRLRGLAGDRELEFKPFGKIHEPSPVASIDATGFRHITSSLSQVDPTIVAVPSLTVAGTDSKHYRSVSENVYRFRFNRISREDIKRYHGVDERVRIEDLKKAVLFYRLLFTGLEGLE
ncbi:MAG: M20/M25/M40 family metallo-hydrolase [Gammaproteobacteria bacterium]|nr:M20/M25/M40 family metallo-hydrolase [Gammaproteobacteria bacterium]MDH5800192.1 M20/M25/M40 family metallo-hydrolase [Gammaproteobacteria bacterium]